MSKLTVCLIFGGKSDEHAVSLISANGILNNLDGERYEIQKVGITRQGEWLLFRDQAFLNLDDPNKICLNQTAGLPLVVTPSPTGPFLAIIGKDQTIHALERPQVVFPILHGPFGEDGTIQGLFEICQIPYVGSGVLGSSIGMDKAVTKQLLENHKIPTTPFLSFHQGEEKNAALDWKKISSALGNDLFVKPANLGSSVGISHAKNETQYLEAVALAFKYDKKILVEKTIRGRELETAVLGNYFPKATRPAEIRPNPKHDFYTYEAKYIDPNGAELIVPAVVKSVVAKELQRLAVAAFTALNLRGLARVDFFYDDHQEKLYLNEVNTMPGFTPISMYPKLWQHEGLGYAALLDQLIQLALGNESIS
jgi:D-alanine-D-alanine ligase